MIDLVSGYMRTGTSMMMKALEAGGEQAVYNDDRSTGMNRRHGDADYQPNGGGFYELSRHQYMEPGFPSMYEGKLVKHLYGGIVRIAAGDYRVVFMRRDAEEVRQSFQAFFGTEPPQVGDAYIAIMENAIGILRQLPDVQLTVLQYRDVVYRPLEAFHGLGVSSSPLVPAKAAAVFAPDLYRFRLLLLLFLVLFYLFLLLVLF